MPEYPLTSPHLYERLTLGAAKTCSHCGQERGASVHLVVCQCDADVLGFHRVNCPVSLAAANRG